MAAKDRKPADPRQRKLDKQLDEALAETFPASDPPAITEPLTLYRALLMGTGGHRLVTRGLLRQMARAAGRARV